MVLNCVLLFVVLFFVYPLKVVANNLVPLITGIGESGFEKLSEYDNRFLMVCYSSGVVAVFLIFVLFNWNALRQRHQLDLTAEEVYDARSAMRAHGLSVLLGVTSIVLAVTLPGNRVGLAGMIYALEGPFQGIHGYVSGTRREKMFPSSTPAPQ